MLGPSVIAFGWGRSRGCGEEEGKEALTLGGAGEGLGHAAIERRKNGRA